jgi:PAS domain S-box-containing protein
MTINPPMDLAIMTVRYQKLLDRIPYLAWLITDRGEFIMVNQQWHEYFGKSSEMETFLEFLRTEERDQFSQQWAAAKKSQKSLEIKLQLPSSAGNWEWFQVELEPDSNEGGQIIWIGTAIRLGGEANLTNQQDSFQFLEALLDHASDGIVACNAAGKLVLFNRMAQIFHELPPEPIDPEEWAAYYDLYDRDGLKILSTAEIPLFRALQGESVVSQEIMIKSKQGKARSILTNGATIYSPTGEKLGAVALMQDISQLKQAEVDRTDAERYSNRLSIALQVAKAGAWHWNLVSQKIFWTPEFEILFDYEPGSTRQVYSEWLTRIHPDDREWLAALLEKAVNQTLSEYRCEYRIVHRDGQIRWIDMIGELNTDEQGNLRLSGLAYDITERKKLAILTQTQNASLQSLNNSLMLTQQSLKIRNEELDSFGHMVSHDLKAPLRSIANLSEWIEEDLSDRISEDNQKQFQLLRQRVNRMDALIDELLHYSRIGRQRLEIETVDVAQLLAEIIDALDPPASFKIEILSPLPTLDTKRILLDQIFANLLSNAIKHHHQTTGQIEITAADKGDHYQFSIADDGPGIPPGRSQERIFEIFQTLQPNVSSENTGIGLALVKKIIEGEGGQIWLEESSQPGACFHFTWGK